jgi:hypothetical protein
LVSAAVGAFPQTSAKHREVTDISAQAAPTKSAG